MPMSRPSFLSRRSRSYDGPTHTFERSSSRCSSPRSPYRNTRKEAHSASRDKLSPLSPTFGPRKGLVPSGTVARRRRGPRHIIVPCVELWLFTAPGVRDIEPHPAYIENVEHDVPTAIVVCGGGERRGLWGVGREVDVDVNSSAENLEEAVEEGGRLFICAVK